MKTLFILLFALIQFSLSAQPEPKTTPQLSKLHGADSAYNDAFLQSQIIYGTISIATIRHPTMEDINRINKRIDSMNNKLQNKSEQICYDTVKIDLLKDKIIDTRKCDNGNFILFIEDKKPYEFEIFLINNVENYFPAIYAYYKDQKDFIDKMMKPYFVPELHKSWGFESGLYNINVEGVRYIIIKPIFGDIIYK